MGRIVNYTLDYVPRPLAGSFGFKGGRLTELWQIRCRIYTEDGHPGTGLGVQSVLWSDGAVFQSLGQEEGNRAMLDTTRYALELLAGQELTAPREQLARLLPPVLAYGRQRTGNQELRPTFALNALTPVDWALWQLARQRRGGGTLPELAPELNRGTRQSRLGLIPLISYDTREERILRLAREGSFLFKIKIGSNPGGRGDPEQMLSWDCARLNQIHQLLKDWQTPWTDCGRAVYYLDANGRYDSMERLERLLDFADRIGALERIVLLEEPFPEDAPRDVSRLPVRVAGDESAHSAADAVRLMDEFGYTAMALKPIAKTLTVSLEVLAEASRRGVPCFCADLTVNPAMVELNKRFAAELAPLPGLKIGVFESNGPQNYRDWAEMERESPAWGAPWSNAREGIFCLEEAYFRRDGGIWEIGN